MVEESLDIDLFEPTQIPVRAHTHTHTRTHIHTYIHKHNITRAHTHREREMFGLQYVLEIISITQRETERGTYAHNTRTHTHQVVEEPLHIDLFEPIQAPVLV